jgi:hypothetical protein
VKKFLGKDHGLIHEAVVTGRKAGAGKEFWAKLAHDELLFRDVVALVMNDGKLVQPARTTIAYKPTPSQIRAGEIMGKNFLGIEDAMSHYGAAYTADQLAMLAEVSIDGVSGADLEAMFEECKNTHLLVAGFPMTIVDIRKKTPGKKPKKSFYSYQDAWYNTQAFATDELVRFCWHLIRKTEVENSRGAAFEAQWRLLGPEDYVPRACDLVYAVVLYFMVTRERLLASRYIRCIDLSSDSGGRVHVGFFGADGLNIVDYWGDNDNPEDYIGLSSARKLKK